MDLVEALSAERGVISVVGAGGKKSVMYRLADVLDHAIVTATVRIPPFAEHVGRLAVTTDPMSVLAEAADGDWPLGLVPEQERPDRYLGYDPSVVDEFSAHPSAETVLVKADGARLRKFKAPAEFEPQVPSSTTVVVPVVSAHVIGQPLSEESVHRIDRVAALTGLSPGQVMSPEAIATVLASPEGGRKQVPSTAEVIPVINMVDDDGIRRRAETLAQRLVDDGGFDRVVMTRLTAEQPVVDVVHG